MRVRRAGVEDARRFVEVLAEVSAEGDLATQPPFDEEARAEAVRAMIEDPGPEAVFALEIDGRDVGFLGLHAMEDPGVMAIGMMVLAEGRGRGGGRALLESAIDHARRQGVQRIYLEVFEDNARAIALYRAAGFTTLGRTAPYPRRDGSERAALRMEVELAAE